MLQRNRFAFSFGLSFALGAAAIATLGTATIVRAQEYPTKPITLIVPWPAGGSTDISMRAIADAASKHLGQPIAIDNKGGGGGTVGPATMAAAAKPDGYTISQIPITVFRLPLMQEVSWNPDKDFSYIPSHRLHFRHHHQCGIAVQDLEGCGRFRQGESGQSDLCDARHRHLAACGHGADRGTCRHQAHTGAVQGRRRDECRGARQSHYAAGRFHRLASSSMPASCVS